MSHQADEARTESRAKRSRRSTISVRFAADEKQLVAQAAASDGLEPGAWLRYHALRQARKGDAR